jgi:tRNA C32,U32 (ribose-2'-O)-methylase TrmJ
MASWLDLAAEQQQQQQQQQQEQQVGSEGLVTDFVHNSKPGLPTPTSGVAVVRDRRSKLALVFGREESGLLQAEIDGCDWACSIPIGRLQESLSLSHAVSLVLSHLFERRISSTGLDVPESTQELAAGFDAEEWDD